MLSNESIKNMDSSILLSIINTNLRDYYNSFESFCDDKNLDEQLVTKNLATINYFYDKKLNKFI